jgi:hypothetical protein
MPTRKRPGEDESTLPQASLNAIASRMGRPVTVDSATDEIENVVEDFKEASSKPQAEVNTYGSNYYKINSSTLPSRGVFYNGTDIWLRNFKVVEIKRLAYINEESANSVINEIMGNLVQGIEWEQMKTADKIAIIFYVRMNTFPDPSYKINYTCNKHLADGKLCAHDNKLSFTANDLKIKYLPDTYKPDDQVINLPNGDVVKWRFPEIGDEKAITVAAEQIKFAFEKNNDYKGTEVDSELVSVAYLIETINGQELTPIEKYLYITEVAGPAEYVIIFREITTRFEIGLDPEVEAICSKCGGRVQVPVMFSPEFFLPEYSA